LTPSGKATRGGDFFRVLGDGGEVAMEPSEQVMRLGIE